MKSPLTADVQSMLRQSLDLWDKEMAQHHPAREETVRELREAAVDSDIDSLCRNLLKSLKLWADYSQRDDICLIAARAYMTLRASEPKWAEAFNGLLHRLTGVQHAKAKGKSEEESHVPSDTILDVRSEVPARRHEMIFETFKGLSAGEAFILVNDHDPKPLYYQFEFEYTGLFSWDYLEEGPEVWRVRIGKTKS